MSRRESTAVDAHGASDPAERVTVAGEVFSACDGASAVGPPVLHPGLAGYHRVDPLSRQRGRPAATPARTWTTRHAMDTDTSRTAPPPAAPANPLRFHRPHMHLDKVFGNDWFALRAEAFARFFGTPRFLVGQTAIVAVWIVLNVLVLTKAWHFDEYPFILLNLAFSLQAAYAAPLILLAQTRQADRDSAHAQADAAHREDLARASLERQALAAQQTAALVELLNRNTQLTELTNELSVRIERLTSELHAAVVRKPGAEPVPPR